MALKLLQDIQIRKAKPKDKTYSLNDGGGLRLLIKPNSQKTWMFRFTLNGKRRETTFKSYPKVSLTNARKKRDEYLNLIAQDIDPIEHNKKLKEDVRIDKEGMFKNVMIEWFDRERERVKEITHKKKFNLFQIDVLPFLIDKHIKDITINDIILIIDTKQKKAHDTAVRLFNYLDKLFRYSVMRGYTQRNILADINKHDLIKPKQQKHYPKITNEETLKELINCIYNYQGGYSVRNALKFVLHLPLRAENLSHLKWEYIDFDKKTLTIPRELMKVKDINLDDYKMPLTDEVINILEEQKKVQTTYTDLKEYVFLGTNNISPINPESPNRALQRMGFNDEKRDRRIRLHGFRGTFRSMIDTLDEKGLFTFEAKERALDHHEKNAVVKAYNHKANYYKQLEKIMNFWSNYILELKE